MTNSSNSLAQIASVLIRLNAYSNLVVHLAESDYEQGNYSQAANTLEGNLPDVSAQILLSKTYAHLGKYHLALQTLKSACDAIHSPRTFEFYLKEFEGIKQLGEIKFDSGLTLPPDFTVPDDTEQKQSTLIDETKTYESLLVSETLANIYISQGELKEAIKIYEKLIERKPENKEKYLQSIEELKSRLGN